MISISLLVYLSLLLYVDAYKAQGNLAVVIKTGDRLFSSDDDPLTAYTPELWCQAADGDTILELSWARFVRTHDRQPFEASIDDSGKRARLILGEVPVSRAGKYRCEMRTTDSELLYGNMFVNTRPYVHNNGTLDLEMSDIDPTLVISKSTVKLTPGQSGALSCPVKGFPHPTILWYKDGAPLEESDNIFVDKDSIEFALVSAEDAGVYQCVAFNRFSMVVDGKEQEFEVKFEQIVEMRGGYDWVLPLTVILIILILLFIIIYSCQACKRYKAAQYNVNERERRQGRTAEEARALKADAV
ncbi:unnamed protein product [Auanema sp. JU1783]|nr:unnamed protein product [Auanema sp. JU1783]